MGENANDLFFVFNILFLTKVKQMSTKTTTLFMVFSAIYIICKGPKLDPSGLKVSRLLIANMILFVNIGYFLSENFIYIITFSIAHWDT